MDVNGVEDSFLSENNEEWAFLINSDYSDGESNEKSRKKVADFNNASYSHYSPLLAPNVDNVATSSTGVIRVVLSGNDHSGDDDKKNEVDVREPLPGNHERHLWTEKERRKKMRNMFTDLQALLPHQLHHPKVDKCSILDEAVKHIKRLESTLSDLQRQKLEILESWKTTTILGMGADECGTFASNDNATMMMRSIPHMTSSISSPDVFKTWTSPNMTLNMCGNDAHINICCSKKIGVLAAICSVLEKYKIDVISAHVSSDHNRSMYMIHARVIAGVYERQFPVEEIYKEAAREIIGICG
ncbi:transcription factor bHLH95-like [Ipomoea triloba]|uniref:transcription factor bHLH95-like n=1 Tax=Ipomoea triloba TaxID=35885 RepID=UPI00125CF51B|nr:transcription factor bHLH95-like [Ipomoea triloba]